MILALVAGFFAGGHSAGVFAKLGYLSSATSSDCTAEKEKAMQSEKRLQGTVVDLTQKVVGLTQKLAQSEKFYLKSLAGLTKELDASIAAEKGGHAGKASKRVLKTGEAPACPPATAAPRLKPQLTSSFCPPEVSNNKKWRETRTKWFETQNWGGFGEGQGMWKQDVLPTYFCDKLHYNLMPWVKPKLAPEDVVMGIFTGETLFYGRASAVRDTWLLHFPHHYIFSAQAEERIPVIGLATKYGKKYPSFGADYKSGADSTRILLLLYFRC
jgi:hypothetical protein